MPKSVVKQDDRGIRLQTGGYIFRPGEPKKYYMTHIGLRHDDGGLTKGDRVKARHMGGTPIAKITLDNGEILYWESE